MGVYENMCHNIGYWKVDMRMLMSCRVVCVR